MRKIAMVFPEACRKCGCCVRSCPMGLIYFENREIKIKNACLGCGNCSKSCPFNAIKMIEK